MAKPSVHSIPFRFLRRISFPFVLLMGLGACQDEASISSFQGYGEGEYIYLSAYEAGNIKALFVTRGSHVDSGQTVFTLDDTIQANRLRDAESRLEIANHQLANLMTGKREQEIAVLLAGQKRAKAALDLSKENLSRKIKLRKDGFVSQAAIDQVQAELDRDKATFDELNAQITSARLTARVDEIGAGEALVQSATIAVETARWYLQKRTVLAPKSGLVEDVLYDISEHVQPGKPVVSLLPDDGVKVRFFIPESRLGEVQEGQAVTFSCDGCPSEMDGTVRFISKKAEFTPPVIFSQPSQQKLVFMAEAWPTGKTAIHPGQPVEVRILGLSQ